MYSHIKQNAPGVLSVIQKIGCFYRSCGIIAEIHTGKSLEVSQINEGWLWSKKKGYIGEDDCIVQSAPIITHMIRLLDPTAHGRMIEVGLFKDGVTTYYPAAPLRRIDYLIQKIRQPGPSKTHFRVVNKSGELLEDPHSPIIKVSGIEYSILYAWKDM